MVYYQPLIYLDPKATKTISKGLKQIKEGKTISEEEFDRKFGL